MFVASEIGAHLVRYEREPPWNTLVLWDEPFFDQIGEIPIGGKPLPEACYKATAEWFVKVLRGNWPNSTRMGDSMECLEITESHGLVRELSSNSDTIWALPISQHQQNSGVA